jgi:ABC-type transport system substrate-binding protein
MNRVALVLFALCSGFLFSGCAQTPRIPGTLRLASKPDPSTLDPARAYDTTSINFVRVIYNGLVDYDDNARIVGMVARDWTISPDGKTYTFHLRPNVKFHSGRRVVAEDFRYSLERILDPETASDGLSFYSNIEGATEFTADREKPEKERKLQHVHGIRVKGDDEISFTLIQPDVAFLNVLALPFGFVVPREHIVALEAQGKTLSDAPNGCGPFKLESWQHDASLKLVRNKEYFRPGIPRVERINTSIGGDETLHLMQFELGDIDVMNDVPPADFARLTEDPRWKKTIIHAPMMDVRYLCMNMEMQPFDDVRVRQAFNYAINKERLVQVQSGRVSVARGILPPGMPGYNTKLRGYEYNPDKARALLKAAGKENLNLTLWVATIDGYDKVGQSIQQDLKNVGVTVSINKITYKELKTLAGQRKKIPLCILGWLQDYSDPANFLDVLFNSKSISNTASLNRAFYSDKTTDSLLSRAAIEQNPPTRLQMYQQVEQRVMDAAPWVPLYHSERYVMRQPWVSNYNLHPMWSARYEYVGVEDAR